MLQHENSRPLLFIVQDSRSFKPATTSVGSKAISTHVNRRYRGWKKITAKSLELDSTTKAILTARLPTEDFTDTNEDTDSFLTKYRLQLLESSNTLVYTSINLPLLRQRKEKLALLDKLIVPQIPRFGNHPLDPFAPDIFKNDHELQASLFFYIKTIRPFTTHLLKDWLWFDNLSQIQSSPVLAYAVASYASIFLSGSLRGGPGVVLPPPVEQGQQPLWRIPPWLRLQTSCLAELSTILRDPIKIDESCYQAILFLFRLAVSLSTSHAIQIL